MISLLHESRAHAAPSVDQPIDAFRPVPVSELARAVLIQLATGDLDRPISASSVDWDAVLTGIYRHNLHGLTHRYLMNGVSRDEFPEAFRDDVAHSFKVSQFHSALMYRWITEVTSALSDAGINSMMLKGPALAHLVYPDENLRTFGDLDLMIRECDMMQAHAVLGQSGFIPEVDIAAVPAKLTHWCTTYELRYTDRTRGFLLEMHYDDLLNAGLRSRDRDGYWARSRIVTVQDCEIATLSLEDHLVHLCCHMHFHGYVRLSWFADLALLVRDHGDELNWDQVVRTVRVEEAQTPVMYSLRYLEQLSGVAAPPTVMHAITPDRIRRRLHEYYLPDEQVLAFEPMPRPDFSFYFQPVFKRLIPDLLVMGRRREKLQTLLRLAVPPAEWLRYYYAVPADAAIWPQFVLHPLKLTWHLIREIAEIPSRGRPWWNSEA